MAHRYHVPGQSGAQVDPIPWVCSPAVVLPARGQVLVISVRREADEALAELRAGTRALRSTLAHRLF